MEGCEREAKEILGIRICDAHFVHRPDLRRAAYLDQHGKGGDDA